MGAGAGLGGGEAQRGPLVLPNGDRACACVLASAKGHREAEGGLPDEELGVASNVELERFALTQLERSRAGALGGDADRASKEVPDQACRAAGVSRDEIARQGLFDEGDALGDVDRALTGELDLESVRLGKPDPLSGEREGDDLEPAGGLELTPS